MELVLGIDGGGTSCRAALASSNGEVIGYGKSGPANIMTDLQGARQNIIEAAQLAFADAKRDPALIRSAGAVLGLAGTNVGNFRHRLPGRLPFRESVVESDALIALNGALGAHEGAIAIIGTGSIFMARHGGRVETIGGWGFMLGDLGGGARIGRELLQETLLAHDDIHAASKLTTEMLNRFEGDPRKIVAFAATAKPADFGVFAPRIFEHAASGDEIARRILERAAHDVEEALDALKMTDGSRLCLLGGLAGLFEPHLPERYKRLVKPPLQDALGGAVSMALRRFGDLREPGDG